MHIANRRVENVIVSLKSQISIAAAANTLAPERRTDMRTRVTTVHNIQIVRSLPGVEIRSNYEYNIYNEHVVERTLSSQ